MLNNFKLNKVNGFGRLVIAGVMASLVSVASANIVKDTYHDAKDGAKKVYHKGKKAAKNFVDAEKRGLKVIVHTGGRIIKTEYDLARYLATRPAYVVSEFSMHNRKRPPRRPDLVVSKLFTDRNGYVIVTIKNIGHGHIILKPRHKTVDLYFKLNGKGYGGVTHKIFDPRAKLVNPGGSVTYRTNLKINKKTKVTAIIDYNNAVIESNERNNAKTAVLPKARKVKMKPVTKVRPIEQQGRTAHKDHTIVQPQHMMVNEEKVRYMPKADLTVSRIFLTRDCRVAVKIENIGKGSIPASVWTKHTPQSANVYLLRNGKKWGGATIYGFDKRRHLQKPGGKAVYISNLKPRNGESITAIVDMTNEIKESNENNNEMTETLNCNR